MAKYDSMHVGELKEFKKDSTTYWQEKWADSEL